MLKSILIGTSLLLACQVIANSEPYVVSDNCLQRLEQKDFTNLVPSCIWSTGDNVKKSLLLGTARHSFGSYDLMTEAAKFVKSQAEQGDKDFQHFWGAVVLRYMYASRVSNSNFEKWRKIHQESQAWISRAAEAGQPDAQLDVISQFLGFRSDNKTEADKARALKYANSLIQAGYSKVRLLRKEINATETSDELIQYFKGRVEIYRHLSTSEIRGLAKSLINGRYRHGQSGDRWVEFDADLNKSVELLRFLVDEKEDPEAGFLLAKLYVRTAPQEAVSLLTWSAEKGFPEASGWLGDYYACHGDKIKGLVWLKKAEQLGYEYAEDSIGELEELGAPQTCYRFIAKDE